MGGSGGVEGEWRAGRGCGGSVGDGEGWRGVVRWVCGRLEGDGGGGGDVRRSSSWNWN